LTIFPVALWPKG